MIFFFIKKLFSCGVSAYTAERLPLEVKLAAKPTDEVVSENREKQVLPSKTQDFHLIRLTLFGTFPSRGRQRFIPFRAG